jgi:hypothetical protein
VRQASPRRSSARFVAFTLLLYVLLAVASTWPLARDPGGQVPRGTLDSVTIPLVSAWALWWTADRAAAGFESYWDAPIFHPARRAFALSEPMPLLGVLVAPLFWAGASPVLAYSLTLLLALVVNGGVVFGLLRALGLQSLAAAAGGAIAVVLPYTHREVGVLTLVPLAGIAGTLWAVVAFARRPSPLRGVALGAAFGATYLVCAQHALFLGLALLPAAAWLAGRELLLPRAIAGALVAAATGAALVAPVAVVQLDVFARSPERSESAAISGSAGASTWRTAPWRPLLPTPGLLEPDDVQRRGLFPGAVKLALAAVGLGWGLRRREQRRVVAFLATVALVGLALTLLPRIQVGGESVYALAGDVVPGLAQLRSLYRAGVLVQLALALLAAYGLHGLLPRRAEARGALRSGAALALAVLAVVELWPVQQGFSAAPAFGDWRSFGDWIERNVAPDEAMAFLPLYSGGPVKNFETDARWMVLQSLHGRPMVNGYSSYVPGMRRAFARDSTGFPDAASHELMLRYGVRWAVVRPSWLELAQRPPPAPPGWRAAHRDPALDVAVYEVLRRAPQASEPAGRPAPTIRRTAPAKAP